MVMWRPSLRFDKCEAPEGWWKIGGAKRERSEGEREGEVWGRQRGRGVRETERERGEGEREGEVLGRQRGRGGGERGRGRGEREGEKRGRERGERGREKWRGSV